MPPPPGCDEDDETLSLLANQDSPGLSSGGPYRPLFSSNMEESLPEGNAEKTFYTVCTNSSGAGLPSSDDEVIDAVNDILTDINNDILNRSEEREECNENASRNTTANNHNNKSTDARSVLPKGASGKSGSLVVDVHIDPNGPNSSPEEDSTSEPEMHPHHSSLSSSSASSNSSSGAVSGKAPSKHAVNRFQRCYSDSSHSSPKGLRGKYTKWIKAQENADKIETIYDGSASGGSSCKKSNSSSVPSSVSPPSSNCTKGNNPSSSSSLGHPPSFEDPPGGFPHRYRHFSESAHERFNLQEELFQFKQNFHYHYSRNRGLRPYENGMEQKRKSDPVKIESVKFDLFGEESSNPEEDVLEDASLGCSKSLLGDSEDVGALRSSASDSSASLRPSVHHGLYLPSSTASLPAAAASPSCMGTLQSDSSSVDEEDFPRTRLPPPFPSVLVETGSCLSNSSSTASLPACRICQLPSMEPNNQLISPCRCLGSIRYVHNNCLLKWLEVSSKRRNGTASCELCQYQYLRHKKFVISHWRFPECSFRDKILHLFFIISVCLMITCAAVTILCFKEDRGPYRKANSNPGELTSTEMITLSCGVLFFFAFFIAMYVEVKAKNTVYQLICKFFYMNHEWSVEEYDRRRDLLCSKTSPKNESTSCLA
eukprot:TRINITY_DN3733_c0_g1_i1.p1 TRINITY_DN3733_c0_g1~~TRINITY_DN3733_c0_g1_i1.p1  ORF type:complete len:654 (-),score=148.15 TRINITY_DN3733_c0_g1_i1:1214-3175(-)